MSQSVATRAHATRLTLEEWADLPEDQEGEVVGWELVEEEMPTIAHETVFGVLFHLLFGWAMGAGARVFGPGVKYAVADGKGRKSDLSVFLPGTSVPAPSAHLIDVPPSICVEIVSPNPSDVRRDRIEKLNEYAAFGVRYYWIVDPQIRSFEIFELSESGRYLRFAGVTGGQLEVPGCDGLVIDVDAVWQEIDRQVADTDDPSSKTSS